MRYYHDLATRTVYEEPEPWIEEKRGVVEVMVTVKVIRGTNYRKPNGLWAEGWSTSRHEQYACSRTEAENIFRSMRMGDWGELISKEEFDRLAAQYRAEANSNNPPPSG
ncbi:hypothetical protein [Sorangium sp. So ce1000]|uniref:hypothetical protein n=1 Tax=Sorangium sp. So ce1000 TaxID=3133325 RepID=UPI003F619F6B